MHEQWAGVLPTALITLRSQRVPLATLELRELAAQRVLSGYWYDGCVQQLARGIGLRETRRRAHVLQSACAS